MKLDFKSFFKLAIGKLFLLIGIIFFVLMFSFFLGNENQLMAVGVITGVLMFLNIDLGIDKKQAPFVIFGIFLLMAVANIVSFYNVYLAIIFNIFTIYLFMTLSTIHLAYKTYIPFVLIYIFADGFSIEENQIGRRLLSFFVSSLIFIVVYSIKHRKIENGKTIKDIFKEISISKETTVFNIKMTLGLVIAMFLSRYFNIEKGMWISITVMSLTQPHFSATKQRIKHRFLGTVIGFIIFIVLFEWIVPKDYIGILAIITSYVYTFIKDYHIQIIFITINSLNAASGIFSTSYHSGFYRISFIILGTLIVLFIVFLEKMLDKKVTEYPKNELENLEKDEPKECIEDNLEKDEPKECIEEDNLEKDEPKECIEENLEKDESKECIEEDISKSNLEKDI